MKYFLNKKFISVFVILVLFVFVDQWTKELAVHYLKGQTPIEYANGYFQLVYAENPGAFLGMGGNMSRPVRFVIFGLFVVLGLIAMLWSVMKNKFSQSEVIAYSLILAGGIGNVIDRLTHEQGHVIDFMFIDLKFNELAKTGVFNIADLIIVIGVIVLLLGHNRKQTT